MPQKIFIASTSSSNTFAKLISAELSPEFFCRVWDVDTFSSDENTLDSLLQELLKSQFAIMLFTAEDELGHYRGKAVELKIPRDNIVFEAGLFIAGLGRSHVAICVQTQPNMALPSDLNGLNPIEFPDIKNVSDEDLRHFVKSTASEIKKQFAKAQIEETDQPNLDYRTPYKPLEFGDSRHTGIIVDSAFQPTDRKGISAEITRAITSKRVIPTKLFYATEEGASSWLLLTGDAGYHFFNASIDFLRQISGDIAKLIADEVKEAAPDYVSLGSGDGRKDAILLPELIDRMAEQSDDGKLAYFPLDFSFYLITETIKNVSVVLNPDQYKIKPIVGDIIDLASFQYVYEHKPNVNIFSILGNTLGNNDENEIISSINASLFDGDFVIIEVNTHIPKKSNFKNSDIVSTISNLKHGFTPLGVVGYNFDPDRFSFEFQQNRSGSPDAVSILTKYADDKNGNISITLNHRYDFDKFCPWIANQLRCEVVSQWQNESKQVGIVLLRRSMN